MPLALTGAGSSSTGTGIPGDAYTTPDGLDYYKTPDGLDYYSTP